MELGSHTWMLPVPPREDDTAKPGQTASEWLEHCFGPEHGIDLSAQLIRIASTISRMRGLISSTQIFLAHLTKKRLSP